MSAIIDFHSHILPGIDDGSKSLKESLSMLELEAEQEIRYVVATPHFYAQHDDPERFLRKRKAAEEQLREALEMRRDLPAISVGAEVYFFSGMSHSDILPYLTIGEKRCILIEMPNAPWSESMYRELAEIRDRRDLIPIIAHVDRYISPFRTYGIPERLEQLPVLVQANASFFLNRKTRGMAMKMLREDRIHLLGSDCHNLSSRLPNLGPAVELIEQRFGSEMIEQIVSYQDVIGFGSNE